VSDIKVIDLFEALKASLTQPQLSEKAKKLLLGLQISDQTVLDEVYPLQETLDELIKAGLVESGETFIRDYSYVTMFELTKAGWELKVC